MDWKPVRTQIEAALVDAGLERALFSNWKHFNLRMKDSYSHLTVTVTPGYSARQYGTQHATFRIGLSDDVDAKTARIVSKAKECVEAEHAAVERQRRAYDSAERRKALMREAAARAFPDFEYAGTSRDGIYLRRDADGCEVFLVMDGKDEVAVREVKFEQFNMTIAQARALTGEAPAV